MDIARTRRRDTRVDACQPSLWRQDTTRDGMRGASGQGKATLSHARRRRRLWCAQGQSECAQARQVHQERECRSTRYEKAYSRGEEVPGRAQVLMPKVINVWPSNQDGALPTLLADGETQPRFPSGKPILGKRPRCGPSPVGLGVRRRGGLGLQRNKMRFEITWLFGSFSPDLEFVASCRGLRAVRWAGKRTPCPPDASTS